jgi:hypothetical protein
VLEEHDLIVLTEDLDGTKFRAGDVGTIVYLSEDSPYYEVEFVTRDGQTIDVVTVHATQVRPVKTKEVLHVRALD